jgi:nucleoside phosphorylase
MIVCAGASEQFDFALPVGVGMVESAMNLTRLCLLDKPEYILFVGSAGSYGEYNIFDIVESRGAAQIELSFLQGKSHSVLDNVITSEFEGVSHETIINSSNYISLDAELVQNLKPHNIGLENMEFFSVLRVAQEFEIPVAGIFVVSNYCHKDAHVDFLKNHTEAKLKLENYVKKHIIKHKSET